MKKKINQQEEPVISKIEIDKKTAEPVLVEVPLDEIPQTVEETTDVAVPEKKKKKRSKEEFQLEMPEVGFVDNSSISKKQKLFKNICMIAFVVLVVGVLAFTFYNDFLAPGEDKTFPSWSEILGVFGNYWYFLILAFVAIFGCYFFKGAKLSVMCKALTGKAHFKTCIETGIIGTYYNNVTPLAVGGQPFEIYHLSKHGVHGGVASSMPIATFFLNQFAFVILSVISIIFMQTNVLGVPESVLAEFSTVTTVLTTLAIIGSVLCIFVPGLVIMFSIMPRTCSKLVHFVFWLGGKLRLVRNPKVLEFKVMKTVIQNAKCIKIIASRPLVFLSMLLLSFLEQFANVSIAFFTLKFFGFNIGVVGIREWLIVSQFCFILYSSISFVPTPGNSGAADLSFYLLFNIGLISGFSFPAMLVWRCLSFYFHLLFGFVFTTYKRKSDHKKLANGESLE
ncbi:MAG: flippase-like domain-containing protein [Clostridiales bacterium]|nr:flippase-like domain-containing protein [Clostridiales bacterium]